ncbi:MFS transporter [uncultured Aeromicrobium sp.]|uniref:MFS transporter n=1 Tax=uncultured Aeromicrobium sp. TaxID=337820 RepID=UPI0025DF63FE|nr:MFS transporter [uncultured Aeromicrobium sp.]
MTTSTATQANRVSPQPQQPARIWWAIVALALGGFAIGTTEFVTMGLLPDIAASIDRSIPTTGHLITAYALGVVVGAPLIVSLGAKLPKRELAIVLVLALALGNGLTAVASGYVPVMLSRFVAGLPHGAYFGVASLLAAAMVPPSMRGRAVSRVMMGLSVGTVAGVPLSAWLGQELGWRAAYALVVVLALATALMIRAFVARVPGTPDATIGRELAALRRPQVLFAVAAGMIGFGGVFAMYSYIAPIVTDVSALSRATIPWVLFVFGIGSVAGTWLGGVLADWNNVRQIVAGFLASVVALVAFYFAASSGPIMIVLVFVVSALGSVLAIGLQLRLMNAAGDAQMLGAALNHSSLNVANGLGAWLGGLVIAAGHGYAAPSLVGAALAAAGLVIVLVAIAVERRSIRL